jgi:hypothetical protein
MVCLRKRKIGGTQNKVNNQVEYSMDIPVGNYSAINLMPYRRSTSSNIIMYATLLSHITRRNKQMPVKLISVFRLQYSRMRHHGYQCSGETCIFKIANMLHLIIILALTNMKKSNFKYLDVTYNHIIS